MKPVNITLIFIFFIILTSGCGGGDAPSPINNSSPIANAGADQAVITNQEVSLDGSKSSDPDGDNLHYQWEIISKPKSSNARLSSSSIPTPTFIADIKGSYVLTLVVSDGSIESNIDEVIINATEPPPTNTPPTANAGPDQTVTIEKQVILDSSRSFDPDGDSLSFQWSIKSKPVNSTINLDSFTVPNPNFTADLDGEYVFTLIVSDGVNQSNSDEVIISAKGATSSKPVVYIEEGKYYYYQPDFSDWNNDTNVNYAINNKPNWAQFNEVTGELTGIAVEFATMRSFFEIQIIATKNGEQRKTIPFNISLTGSNGKLKSNMAVFVTSFADTISEIDPVQIASSYERMREFTSDISHNRQQLSFDIHYIGAITEPLSKIRAWAETSTFLDLAFKDTNPANGEVCNLDDILPAAQAIFEKNIEHYQSYYGYEINALDLTFAQSISSGNPCAQNSSGDIAISYINLPTDMALEDYETLIFHFFDDNYHSGASQYTLGLRQQVKQGNQVVIGKEYILSGATNTNQIELMKFPDFAGEAQADYYTGNQVKLSQFERQTVHEIVHALGIGTHDCGLDYYKDIDFSKIEDTLQENNYANFGYGDWFSFLGAGKYSLDLAPSSKEYLGWVNSNEIHHISSSTSNVTIGDAYSIATKPYAKIKTSKGWLYVSLYTGKSYGESLTHVNLANNLQGVQLRYTGERDIETFRTLTTSVLLDPNENLKDHDYSLKPGKVFEIYGVRISNVILSNETATFDVSYID